MFALTLREVFDMLVLTAAAGFIFMDLFRRPTADDPVAQWRAEQSRMTRFWYAAAIVAPAIILHELGHKIAAISQGFQATFFAAYEWLAIAVVIKLINFPFLFFVPAFVRVIGDASPLQYAAIAFAGPAVNAAIWIVALLVIRYASLSERMVVFWSYVKFINGFLFIFNMLPIPGFDGFQIYSSLLDAF